MIFFNFVVQRLTLCNTFHLLLCTASQPGKIRLQHFSFTYQTYLALWKHPALVLINVLKLQLQVLNSISIKQVEQATWTYILAN